MDRVRLMTWCPHSVGGMHLPAFAASAGGAFAAHGLEVEYVPSTSGCEAVAAGHADFALTSAVHLLTAQSRAAEHLPVRFAATFHQRNPIAAVVRADSELHAAADLAGVRASRWGSPWYADEFAGALEYLGIERPVLVDTPGSLDEALGSGAVDVLPMWMDQTTPAKLQGMVLQHAGEPYEVRAIAIDLPVFSTGLVAADRLSTDLVRRMRDAIAAGHELHRTHPEPGLSAFLRCFSNVSEEYVKVNWALYEPYAFDVPAPGSMDAGRWRETIPYVCETHGLREVADEQVYRPDLLTAEPAARST